MDMDLAIKFGNIDALICKAEQFIQEGDKQNGFRLVLEASRELRSIEISESGERFIKDIRQRQETCASVIFMGKQSCSKQPEKQNATNFHGNLSFGLGQPEVQKGSGVNGIQETFSGKPEGQSGSTFNGNQSLFSGQPESQKGIKSNKWFNLDDLLQPADETIFLEDIIGLQDVKITLLQAIFLPVAIPDFVSSTQRWKGILLFGTSGVGKSKVLKALNNSIKKTTDVAITFVNLTLDVVLGAFHGETEKNLTAIFKAAALKAPIVILFDEIDCLCSSRTNEKSDSETKIINHFLTLLDTVSMKTDLVVVGTTNKIDKMDIAFFRRFQKRLYIELPNLQQRAQLLESLVGKLQSTPSLDFRSLAVATERFSSADLTMLIANTVNAVRSESLGKKVLELMEASKKVNVKDLVCDTDYRAITQNDVWLSLATTCPTNTEEEIRRLDQFASKFCGRQENYAKLKSDMKLPSFKKIMRNPGTSFLMICSCIHDFFSGGI